MLYDLKNKLLFRIIKSKETTLFAVTELKSVIILSCSYSTEKGRGMITELLMTVGFIFKDGEKGKRIVGGAESHYPTDDLGWLDFTGKEILIQTSKGDLYFKVIKIDTFPSISRAINIGLTLDSDTQFDVIKVGDKVFKIIDK